MATKTIIDKTGIFSVQGTITGRIVGRGKPNFDQIERGETRGELKKEILDFDRISEGYRDTPNMEGWGD